MSDSWDNQFKCWDQQDEQKFQLRLDRYCEICGANKPVEKHETWCPNDPDRAAKDDESFWSGIQWPEFETNCDDEVCSCTVCTEAEADRLAEAAGNEEWTADLRQFPAEPYQAIEGPVGEDWGLRDQCLGIGGAPTRATTLPATATDRKAYPVASGVLDYFPDALVAISNLSYVGNEQHNPGQPLHWDRSKSGDEADTLIRHFLQRGSDDTDGIRHSVKMAWRALALLQKEIEGEAM